jgi:glycosyltransferase involved in cell wall biosynthesis
VPVPLAGGTQYKLLESLAVGLPVVASRMSADVAGFRAGEHLLVAESSEEFADAAVNLLQDRALAVDLSRAGRAFIAANRTWEAKRGLLEEILAPGVSKPR